MTRATRSVESRPGIRLLSPLRDFMATETAGAVLLATGAVAALAWANSPWSGSYGSLWSATAGVTVAGHSLQLDLRHWINDGLMAIFFLVVGLEIKRELTSGHLATRRAALLPGLAALGGMTAPALVYLAIAGGTAPRGWAIPMATDIALAMGVLAVVGSRVPASVRAFLLGLAIVDDLGAIAVIAVVYSSGVSVAWLAAAAAAIAATVVARRADLHAGALYWALGAVLWLSLHEAGIHPTIAGVAMGLLAPTTPRYAPDLVDAEESIDAGDVGAARATASLVRGSVSVVEWLQHVLHPWTSFVIVPLFALANTGIEISASGLRDAAGSAITWGVLVGLLAGKPLGVVLTTWTAGRSGLADAPAGARRGHLLGAGFAAGIGFTVATFITELALTDPVERSNAKLGILAASVLAAGMSIATIRRESPAPAAG